jgi:hypothetical protein
VLARTRSVDEWASPALRSRVVEAAGVRSSERRRAWADSSKRASEPDSEPRPRARWSKHYSPRTYAPLTRRLRRAVAVWPEEPGLTPAPTLLRRRRLLLHGHRAASPGAASLGAAPRGAAMRGAACAAPPAPTPSRRSPQRRLRLRLACAAPPAPRCLCRDACAATPHAATPAPRRLTPRRRARRRTARLRTAPRRLARVSAPRRLVRT